jgi:hypothetical protein
VHRRIDPWELLSRWITLGGFGLAIVIYVAAPLLALSWRNRPFPGFMVEQTLVVNDRSGQGWSGREAGINLPQRVRRIAGMGVDSISQYDAVLSTLEVGDRVSVLTESPDGRTRLFPEIEITRFPAADLVKHFWMPYLVGLTYLGIGVWIYRIRGQTRPGRALAWFCVCTAVVCGLLFDVLTTHWGVGVWMVALGQLGGAVTSMAMRFPEEWKPVERRPWLLAVPYIVAIVLSALTLLQVYDIDHPWHYITSRNTSYLFTAGGALFFVGVMLVVARSGSTVDIRRQARVVVLGSAIAFSPLIPWLAAPLFGIRTPFNAALLLPGLLFFPVALSVAILRYRLLQADMLANRAVVYGALTAILAGAFTALIAFSQRIFTSLTGERSDAAIVLTTLIVAAASAPLKVRVQAIVDRQFRDSSQLPQDLRSFGEEVRTFVQMNDPAQISRRLLEETAHALGAQSAAISLYSNGKPRLIHTVGPWRGEAWTSIPLLWQGRQLGLLLLGPRPKGANYTRREVEALQGIATEVAHAIVLSGRATRTEIPLGA